MRFLILKRQIHFIYPWKKKVWLQIEWSRNAKRVGRIVLSIYSSIQTPTSIHHFKFFVSSSLPTFTSLVLCVNFSLYPNKETESRTQKHVPPSPASFPGPAAGDSRRRRPRKVTWPDPTSCWSSWNHQKHHYFHHQPTTPRQANPFSGDRR